MSTEKRVRETARTWEKECKKGFTSYMLLVLLHESPLYGYEMKSKLENASGSIVQYEISAIYHLLKALNGKGYVESYWDDSPLGPKRKYYRITETGRQLTRLFTDSYMHPWSAAIQIILQKYSAEIISSPNRSQL